MGGQFDRPTLQKGESIMFNASYFTYDGVFSAEYGLMIADFDDSSVIETAAFSPSLNTYKPSKSSRFFHNGVKYESAPTHQFSVISAQAIPDSVRREILSWLVGRSAYKKLIIHQPDLENYWYNCVFTNVEIIYVHGYCHGFRLTANFDSHYQYGEPTVITISGTGSQQSVTILNDSDVIDDYIYPLVSLIGTSVSIVNNTDDSSRAFVLSGLGTSEEVVVDNEMRYVESSRGRPVLSNFNKNWLRLRSGENALSVTVNGTCTIMCPKYIMMGF